MLHGPLQSPQPPEQDLLSTSRCPVFLSTHRWHGHLSPLTHSDSVPLSPSLSLSVSHSLKWVSQLLPCARHWALSGGRDCQVPVLMAASVPICALLASRGAMALVTSFAPARGTGPSASPALSGHVGGGGRGEKWRGLRAIGQEGPGDSGRTLPNL